jgi:alanine-glyoxylate transaminase/serine-glyoxylate transaminase/serine-pyruvate transaminase
MSLRHGRETVAIPGPSIMPERVLAAFRMAMPNIYDGELLDVSEELFDRLKPIAKTEGHLFVTIGNGHSAWEMTTSNVFNAGDTVLVLESGRFATVWGETVLLSGVKVDTVSGSDRAPVDAAAVHDKLASMPADHYAAVLMVHVDTATSVRNDVAAIRAAMDAAGSSALLMVDCIASMGCDEYRMDDWGVDVTIAASQKGLMTPPGLGYVWASERAVERGRGNDRRNSYFDWDKRINAELIYQNYSGTPPVSHIFAAREALRMIEEEGGIEAVWARHAVLADAVRAAVRAWSTPDGIDLQVCDPGAYGNCVTTVRTGSIDALELARRCEDGAGVTIGKGLMDPPSMFRIGHMGHTNPPTILGTLGTIEAALHAMGAPIGGSGVAVAADVIGAAL